MLKHITRISLILILFCFFLKTSSTQTIAFSEEFNQPNLNEEIWKMYPNSGSIILNNTTISLSAGFTSSFPFVHSIVNLIPNTSNFDVEIKMKYNLVTGKGTGLIFSTLIPDIGGSDIPMDDPQLILKNFFQIWQDSNRHFYLRYTGDCYQSGCTDENSKIYQKNLNDLSYHIINFRYSNNRYSFLLDGVNIYESEITNLRPDKVWFGNYTLQGSGIQWTGFEIDYIRIKQGFSPLIFLPGMTACYNKALLNGTDADKWNLFPIFGKQAYDNFFDSLNNAGLQENKDWYLFCYDWRKPLAYNSDKLKDFITNTVNIPTNNRSPADPVNLVGHSMGGLISRHYTQTFPAMVNKAIFLGSPNEGAVRTYPAWEGGQLWESTGIRQTLINALIWGSKNENETRLATIRRVVPSLKDLLPTFDFLLAQDTGNYKEIATHHQQNDTLNQLNQNITDPLKQKMGIIYGNGLDTLDSLKIYSATQPVANWVHQTLGLWEDGEPIHTCQTPTCEYTDANKDYSSSMGYSDQGDKTVLVKSAIINGVNSNEIPTDHSGLVNNQLPIQKIFDLLEINGTPLISPPPIWQKFLSFLIHSPAKITVTAPGGKQAGYNTTTPLIENSFYDDEANFLTIPEPLAGDYHVKITGVGNGDYQLLVAKQDGQNPTQLAEYQFPTKPRQIDNFTINPNQPPGGLKDPSGVLSLASAKSKIKEIENTIDKKIYKHCAVKHSRQSIDKAERFLQKSQYSHASQEIEKALGYLNECVLGVNNELLLSLWSNYDLASQETSRAYSLAAQNAGLTYDQQQLENQLANQEASLEIINDNFQEITGDGQTIPLLLTFAFEKTADLLSEAQTAFDQNDLATAHINTFQVEFLLQFLSS